MKKLQIGRHRMVAGTKAPPASYLTELLPSQKINSPEELAAYIENHYKKDQDLPFRIVRAEDLKLDSEGRLYDDEIDFENVIVDAPLLSLRNSRKIRLVNCLFTGDLNIGQRQDDFDSVYLDHCIISKKLFLTGLKDGHIELFRVNASDVLINLVEHAKRLAITECHFGSFCFQNSSADEFFTYLNRFEQIEITDCDIEKTTFDHRQVPALLGTKPPKTFNGFEFIAKIDWGDQAEIDSNRRIASTMGFILDKSHIKLDRDALANAKYRAAMASKNGTLARFVNWLFGAFIKPKRILALVFAGIVGFALLYMLPCFQFNIASKGLGFLDAVYFSGISFLTIGYGDITPIGSARFLAVLEGIVGVALMSSFVVALTRKYVD